MTPRPLDTSALLLSRREVLRRIGGGFGALALTSVFADAGLLTAAPSPAPASNPLAPRSPHFAPRARRLIFLFMNGAPSQVDTFDPKPALSRYAGQPLPEQVRTGLGRRSTGPL